MNWEESVLAITMIEVLENLVENGGMCGCASSGRTGPLGFACSSLSLSIRIHRIIRGRFHGLK